MSTIVLNVDDDQVTLMLHKILIKALGFDFNVEDFTCGEDVLSYLKSFEDLKNKKFLMLLDINMPGMSGWGVLDELVTIKDLDIHVVMVTSSIDSRDQNKSKSYSMVSDFIVKPVNKNKLFDIFQKATRLNQ